MSSMSRRQLMFAATGIAAVAAAPRLVFAQAAAPAPAAAPTGPFTLPPLTYPTNAFEPHIDAKTMEIHHDRHHAAYVANLNNVAKTNPQLGTAKIEDVLGNLNALDDSIKFTVRNNLGGHANHTMFWEIMGPNGGKPEGEVLAAIDQRPRRHGKIPERLQRRRRTPVRLGLGVRDRQPRTASSRSRPARTRTTR